MNIWLPDLARGKPTKQSSIYKESRPTDSSVAVDGNGCLSYGGYTHTGIEYEDRDNWWSVDLQALYIITSVTITPRGQ